MKQIYGFILISWLAAEQLIHMNTDILNIASVLGALCLFIVKEKFFDNTAATLVYTAVSLLAVFFNMDFILLLGIPLIDFTYRKKYLPVALILAVSIFVAIQDKKYTAIVILTSAALFGYITGSKDENERKNLSVLDEERRLRYNLELAQNELINSKKQIERLTEIKERNRIAHEIHDNIGHSIAGVIFQLEGASRILRKDIDKSEEVLKLCGQKLSEALELTRNTVYNIKTEKKVGIGSIEKIIGDFKFCPVLFEHAGDFNSISVTNIQILEANLMECLTNASKYSNASNIHIRIDIGRRNIRFYYKDNGIGCGIVHESVGISGMRERIRNAGGTFSMDGSNGFLIVSNIPVTVEEHEEAVF